jgi:hypothetical protein
MEIIGWIIFFIFPSLSLHDAEKKLARKLNMQHILQEARFSFFPRAIYNERQKTSSYIKLTIITVGFVVKNIIWKKIVSFNHQDSSEWQTF